MKLVEARVYVTECSTRMCSDRMYLTVEVIGHVLMLGERKKTSMHAEMSCCNINVHLVLAVGPIVEVHVP